MSELCKWLHEQLECLPAIRHPFTLEEIPENGIYFFYEEGEIWGHGGCHLRIVRIGTHRGSSLRSRIKEHYEPDMNFDKNRPKPSDRSIFRKNIGRALLNKTNHPYLKIWEIDFTLRENREGFENSRDIDIEKEVESKITEILKEKFSFRFIIIDDKNVRKRLERALIATVAKCRRCRPSSIWLGNYSPDQRIKESGLWQTQHINHSEINEQDKQEIVNAIKKTKEWIRNNNFPCDKWYEAYNKYNWTVDLSHFNNAGVYPGHFNRVIKSHTTRTFEDEFRRAIDCNGSFEIAGEVCFWKNYGNPQARDQITQRLLNHLADQQNWGNFIKAVRELSSNPTYENFQNLKQACGQRHGFATPITFLAFYNPEEYPMVDKHVANWWNENKQQHNYADSPEFVQRRDGWIFSNEQNWNAYLAWRNFCRAYADRVNRYCGWNWRSRDIEMAVWSACSNNLQL